MLAPTMFEWKAADAALVRSARTGDRAAFGTLYQRHKRMVHGILLAHVPHAGAEDLMQAVFLQALQRLPDLRDPEALAGWLAAIARHLATDHHRRNRVFVEINEFNQPRCVRSPGSKSGKCRCGG